MNGLCIILTYIVWATALVPVLASEQCPRIKRTKTLRQWKIEVKTGNAWPASACIAPVWSAVRVGDEWSHDFALDNANVNEFERNALDVFRVNTTSYSCGRLSGFKIFMPQIENGTNDGWEIEWIRYTDEDDPTQVRYCLLNIWIRNFNNPVPNFLFC